MSCLDPLPETYARQFVSTPYHCDSSVIREHSYKANDHPLHLSAQTNIRECNANYSLWSLRSVRLTSAITKQTIIRYT